MKKHSKQFLCMFLVALMVFCMVACGEESTSDTSSSAASGTSSGTTSENAEAEYIDENGMYAPKLGVLEEYVGQEFNLLVVGEDQGTYQSDDFTTVPGSGGIDYGDAYYEEVQARNEMIEQNYGITLNVLKENGFLNAARTDATAGTMLYDAVILTIDSMATLAQENLLYDLKTLDNFDETAPWWDANATAAYTVSDKLYFATGDITIMNKANTWCILFNKQMIEDNGLENPYELYANKTWTFDKMCEMAKTVNTSSATSSWQDTSVTWGMVTAYGDAFMFFGGSGYTLCDKNTADEPVLVFGEDEESISITEKVLTSLADAEWKLYAEDCDGGTNVWSDSFAIFNNGRALFRPSGFTAVTKCRSQATMLFGILPMPLMTETQEEYYTITSGSFAAGILKNCRDAEFSAYMLDAFAAGAKNYVTPAYIEVNLKWKSLRDEESHEILEYLFSHIVYDIGLVYDFGNLNNIFYDMAKNGTADVASNLDTVRDSVLNDIDKVVEAYASDLG